MVVPTTPFSLEREMLEPMLRALPWVLKVDGADVTVLREMLVGGVIPDIVVGIWNRSNALAKLAPLTRVECHVVSLLGRLGPMDAGLIATKGYLTTGATLRALAKLRKQGVLTNTPEGGVDISGEIRTQDVQVIAIEAKLRTWKRALEQAVSYQQFADRSYVVLDGNRVTTSERMLASFREAGVGLLLQYRQVVNVVLSAKRQERDLSPDRVWTLRKLAAEVS